MKKVLIVMIVVLTFVFINGAFVNNTHQQVLLNGTYFFHVQNQPEIQLSLEANNKNMALSPTGRLYIKSPSLQFMPVDFLSTERPIIPLESKTSLLFKSTKPADTMSFQLMSSGNQHDTLDQLLGHLKRGMNTIRGHLEWFEQNDSDIHGHLYVDFEIAWDVEPTLTFLDSPYFPGNIAIIQVNHLPEDTPIALETNLPHRSVSSFYLNSHYFFIPINIWAEPDHYWVSFIYEDPLNGKTQTITDEIIIESRDWVKQYLYIDEQVYATTNSDEAYREFRARAQEARNTSHPQPLWEGLFIMPVKDDYVLTTDYGEIRYVNDAITSSRHSGLDLAAPTGTPIYSGNHGYIVLSEYLILTGNTIIIDHGAGLFTSYYHLDTLSVSVGDFVNKGDFVGTMGSTGFSTGPHLHWSMSIYNDYINTWQVLESSLIQ